jgi:hypothetical protein
MALELVIRSELLAVHRELLTQEKASSGLASAKATCGAPAHSCTGELRSVWLSLHPWSPPSTARSAARSNSNKVGCLRCCAAREFLQSCARITRGNGGHGPRAAAPPGLIDRNSQWHHQTPLPTEKWLQAANMSWTSKRQLQAVVTFFIGRFVQNPGCSCRSP